MQAYLCPWQDYIFPTIYPVRTSLSKVCVHQHIHKFVCIHLLLQVPRDTSIRKFTQTYQSPHTCRIVRVSNQSQVQLYILWLGDLTHTPLQPCSQHKRPTFKYRLYFLVAQHSNIYNFKAQNKRSGHLLTSGSLLEASIPGPTQDVMRYQPISTTG